MLIRKHTLFDSVFGSLVDGPQPAGHARRQADGCGPPPGEAAARAAPRAAKNGRRTLLQISITIPTARPKRNEPKKGFARPTGPPVIAGS